MVNKEIMQEIELLKTKFDGIGEVKGIEFTQIYKDDKFYIYQVNDNNNKYYEVFKRTSVKKCIDFHKKIYSDTEHKEVYPKSNNFGRWAWTFNKLDDAMNKIKQID